MIQQGMVHAIRIHISENNVVLCNQNIPIKGIDIGTQKAVMSAVTGMDFGPPRLPVSPPSKEKIGRIMDEFEKMGFFEWIK